MRGDEGVLMKTIFAICALLLVGGGAYVLLGVLGLSQGGVFHPDHMRVFNGFHDATSELVGGDGVNSVPPDSE